jgi:hypothetical protein
MEGAVVVASGAVIVPVLGDYGIGLSVRLKGF